MANKDAVYTEPTDFIPKEVRKQLGLGEFSPEAKAQAEREKRGNKRVSNDELKRYIEGK